MLHSTCPSMRLNGTTADAPRSLEDLMKKCILLKPKLDSRYFLELGDNPFHKLYRGTNQDIILTKYAHQPTSLSSLRQPAPSTQAGFSSLMFLQDSFEEWGGIETGTQIENPLPSMGPPSKDTPILTAIESQSLRNDNINLLLLISSDSEHSDGDTEVGLPFTERQESPHLTQECEDGVKESLTQAFIGNESFSSIEKTPPLLIRTDEQNLSTNKLTENQQTQDSDSFFNSRGTILFQYTQQMQMQSQSKSSPIIIQDETPLVSMGPSNSLHSSVIIESPNTDTDESPEYDYSSDESDSPTLSSQRSAGSNLITGETATDLHTEHTAISIGNRTCPNFKSKRIKLIKTSPEEKGILTHIKQQQQQQNTHKLITDVFKKPKPVQSKPWTVQEEQLLVIGVSNYGSRWKKIHTNYNFSYSRTPAALCNKYHILKINGEYSRYLREFRKNAGYKSHEQSEPEEYNSDKVPIDETRSAIPRETTTNSEYDYSSIESDGATLSSQHSAGSNLITGETATDLHTEHTAISIGNRTCPNFKPKRIKLIKTSPEEKGILTHIKQQQRNTQKLITDVFKKPKPCIPWTVQEDQLLVIGVSKYGTRWNKIHTNSNFLFSRTPTALRDKYLILKKNGEYSKYLREFRKNTGYKSHEQSEPEEYNSDKVPIDETRSAIPRETTTNSNEINATSDRLTNPANSEESVLRNKSILHSTPEHKYRDRPRNFWTRNEINNLMRGRERFGNDWDAILKNYSFNPTRHAQSLSKKYHRILKRSGDSFYNDIQDPYFLPSK